MNQPKAQVKRTDSQWETLNHDTVHLTHGSRGICFLFSSLGGSVLATPQEQDDHQDDETPSPPIITHKYTHRIWTGYYLI